MCTLSLTLLLGPPTPRTWFLLLLGALHRRPTRGCGKQAMYASLFDRKVSPLSMEAFPFRSTPTLACHQRHRSWSGEGGQ